MNVYIKKTALIECHGINSTGYNTSRAYGTSRLQAASAVGTTDIVTRGFNLGKAMINLPRYRRKNTD